jgi:hypothetical protein
LRLGRAVDHDSVAAFLMLTLLPTLLALAATGEAARPAVAPDAPDVPALADAALSLRYTSRASQPQTWLSIDPVTGEWLTSGLLQPADGQHYPSALVVLHGEVEPIPGLLLRGLVDSGLLEPGSALDPEAEETVTSDGRAVADTFTSVAFVRELSVRWVGSSLQAEAGRQYQRLADGLVYEDFGTGVVLDASLERAGLPLRLEASALAVGRTLDELEQPSPLFWLELAYDLSWFESIGLFGGAFVDRSGQLSDVLGSVLSEGALVAPLTEEERQLALDSLFGAERQSRGTLGYIGASGNLLPADGVSLRGALVGSWGHIETSDLDRTYELASRGLAATAEVTFGLTPRAGLGAFGFLLSGGQPQRPAAPATIEYDAFIGPAPFWAWTGLFFSGGVSQGLYPGRAAAAGVNGHGVVGGGPKLEIAAEDLLVTLRGAYLRARVAPPPAPLGGDGLTYGIEIDATLEWSVLDWLGVSVELDALLPGSFFPATDLAYRGIVQVDVHAGR